MANETIKQEIKEAGLRLWHIADKLGVYDSTLSKKLRRELSDEEKAKIRAIIAELSKKAV